MSKSPKNTIIAFDLHDVIFTFDYKKVAKVLWKWNHKWAIIATLFHPSLVWQLLKMLWHDATDEQFYELFEKRRPILMPLIFEMTNAQKLIPGMNVLLKKLSNKGYELHILSNIGPRRFEQLSKDFPEIISLFKKVKIVQPHGKHSLRKPDKQFFTDYLKEYKQDHQQIIFVDDKKENINAAQELGIDAILYKSPKQLQDQLVNRNIF